MGKIFTYTSRGGVETFKVRYKIDGRSGSTTFPSLGEAEQFNAMVLAWGPRRALEFIHQPTDPKRNASGATVRECVAAYIELQPNAGTRKTYTSWCTNHIEPELGNVRINQLGSGDIQRWLNSQTGASATILRNHILLSAALKEAMLRGEIRTNPACGAKIPRRKGNEARRALTPPYTRAEYEVILGSVELHYKLLVEFLGETGCRFGEAAALTPADVNLDTGQVHFNETYSWQPGEGYTVRNPKTEASDRVIRVKQSLLERLDLSGRFVFTTRAGERVKDNAFRSYHWKRALEKSGLPEHRHGHPHDLRHAHATWLLDAGISLPAIQKRLGHKDVMTTLRMYGHAATDAEDRILAALD
jgi:integrase